MILLVLIDLSAGTYFVVQQPEPSGNIHPTPVPIVSTVVVTIDDANGAEGVLIDHFDDRQSLTAQLPATPQSSGTVVAPDAIGGYRKVVVDAVSGTGKVNVEVDEGGDSLFGYSENVSTTGRTLATWDGTAGDPTILNAIGLNGFDLTGGGVQDSFVLDIQSSQTPAVQLITVYTDATHASQSSFTVPDFTANLEVIFKFSDFTPVPGFAAADFTNVGAITFDIRKAPGHTTFALDHDLHRIQTVGPKVFTVRLAFDVISEIQLVKLTNNTDNNTPTVPVVPVGSTVTWTYRVTNPGNESIANVAVTDNQLAEPPAPVLVGPFNTGDVNTNNLLDPGEVRHCARCLRGGSVHIAGCRGRGDHAGRNGGHRDQ